ncbi:ATP-binding protein [Vibrio aestuarianus]|uniref:AAA family ATPase n=1 Tax=Vibrio aestuarianus TaxID=28171 RepID=UPI00237CEFE9|nr:AAA family ATPase [Vibrio aestuarianus]MDE1318081.1 ATP-binding protein [Vibrio aestuarianus]
MKIYFHPNRGWQNSPLRLDSEPNLLSLSGNNWDDYGTKTTLNASLYFDGVKHEFDFHIKLLIPECDYTALKLNELCASGWDGFFPIPNVRYVSIPSDIDFYTTIVSKLGFEQALQVISSLNDAGYLVHHKEDPLAISLSQSGEFSSSLMRESGANKAFQDGWRIIVGASASEIRDFDLNLITRTGLIRTVPFRFESALLPYDINVLIGPNGIGKSHCLKSLVEYWLQTGMGDYQALAQSGHQPFSARPNISRLILVSYSPFEEFNLDLESSTLMDKTAYRYFGFRQAREDGTIGISRNLPAYNSSESIIDALYDDFKNDFIQGRVGKIDAAERVLKPALSYDQLVLEIDLTPQTSLLQPHLLEINGKTYIPLNRVVTTLVHEADLKNACKLTEGVIFLKEQQPLSLSSGQRLFTFIVINVLGAIRDNSLIVIDEPELFLHPTLEIEFISLLKAVLAPFRSKAILATHSLSVVREVPSNCVHIFREDETGLDVVPPPFETFGGNVQRISSYVFGDKSVSKPFDEWVEEKMQESIDADTLINQLGSEINEELMMKILSLGRKYSGS